jgi:endothelin-converting enzyme/putative endopeptidase
LKACHNTPHKDAMTRLKTPFAAHSLRLRKTALAALAVTLLAGGALVPALADPNAATSSAVITSGAGMNALAGGLDFSIKPGDDFDGYANGGWDRTTDIPADKSRWGISSELAETIKQQVTQLVAQDAAARPGGSDAHKASDYYKAWLDEAAIAQRGLAPLQPLLAGIDAIQDKAQLTRHLGAGLRADVDPLNATVFSTSNLLGLWVAQGFHDEKHYTGYLMQGGLGLPDRDFYVSATPPMLALKAKYQAYVAAMLAQAGLDRAEQRAESVLALETAIAKTHATRDESADILKADNPWRQGDFARKAPGMDWTAFFGAAGLAGQKQFIVWHPGAVKGEAALVGKEPLEVWKDYLRFHAINRHAAVLPKAFSDLAFGFYGTALSGIPQQRPRVQRALDAVNGALPDAVGQLYVEKYFPPEAKAKVQAMVANVVQAFDARIQALSWMAPATKRQARAKLKTLYVGVGYPDKWQSYATLVVDPNDAFGNQERVSAWNYQRALAKLGQAVDPTEWCMAPQVVNAVNMPMQNALNFPAAILQPPFFDPKAPDAANYGAIGATIGHEISHSFDNQGAQFDAKGRLRNWWTPKDQAHFEAASKALVAQYNGYKPFADLSVNGQLTLGENIADLAGLGATFDAYRHALGGKAQDSAYQREQDRLFFTAYAQSWRTKTRENTQRMLVTTDEHAPERYRIATVRNLDAWYQAFDVQPGQALYLEPKARVRVW